MKKFIVLILSTIIINDVNAMQKENKPIDCRAFIDLKNKEKKEFDKQEQTKFQITRLKMTLIGAVILGVYGLATCKNTVWLNLHDKAKMISGLSLFGATIGFSFGSCALRKEYDKTQLCNFLASHVMAMQNDNDEKNQKYNYKDFIEHLCTWMDNQNNLKNHLYEYDDKKLPQHCPPTAYFNRYSLLTCAEFNHPKYVLDKNYFWQLKFDESQKDFTQKLEEHENDFSKNYSTEATEIANNNYIASQHPKEDRNLVINLLGNIIDNINKKQSEDNNIWLNAMKVMPNPETLKDAKNNKIK